MILNRTASEHTTWAELLGGPGQTAMQEPAGFKPALREILVYLLMKAIALTSRTEILVPVDRALRKLKPVRPPEKRPAPGPIPTTPFVFRSLIRALARKQPYIPGHDPSAGKDASRAA